MYGLATTIETLNTRVGRIAAWGILVIVLLQFAVVIMRYVFGFGSIWLQELITYVYASVFMCGAAYGLVRDAHVRVDIFYRGAAERTKAIVDIVGTFVFLWPVTGLLLWVALPYVSRSFAILEGSRETSGLPLVYLLKAEILVFAGLLALQGLTLVVRSAATLSGRPATHLRSVSLP